MKNELAALKPEHGSGRLVIRLHARMAELAGALVSGTSVGSNVQVRPLFRAPIKRRW